MLTKLKKQVQEAMTSQATAAHRLGLTPNQISAIGIILAILAGTAYWQAKANLLLLVIAPILLLASGYCDALDGALARTHHQTTAFGGFLDSLLDRYADFAVLAGIILGGLCNTFWGLITIAGSLLVSYVRARAEAAGVKMETVGIAERAERLLIIILASFLTLAWQQTLNYAIILLAVLTNLTVLQRVIYFAKTSRREA